MNGTARASLADMRGAVRCRGAAILPAVVLLSMSCGSRSSAVAPTPSTLLLTGTWSGGLPLQGTTTRMTWMLTQNGASVTGSVLVALPSGIVLLNGALSGTLSGTTLTYTIAVPPGGIPSQPACTGQLSGSATVATVGTPALAGFYTVASTTCTIAFSSGSFSLIRQ
jgi:hypothetical protein